MTRTSSPFDLLHLGFETARLGMEAQSVIGLRTLGMAGLWNMPSDENHRMVGLDPKDPLYVAKKAPEGFKGTVYPDGKK